MNSLETIPDAGSITFDDYQRLAHQTSVLDNFADPGEEIARSTMAEITEVFFEDGRSNRFLYLFEFMQAEPGVKDEIAKELGDVLWFAGEYAERRGLELGAVATDAVFRNSSYIPCLNTMQSFDFYAQNWARTYSVSNHKLKSSGNRDSSILLPRQATAPELQDRPGYVLTRVLGRLSRKLAGASEYVNGPPTGADFDSVELINYSLGDTLWVTSGVANLMLDTTLADIAVANLVKAQRRFKAGTTLEGADPDRAS